MTSTNTRWRGMTSVLRKFFLQSSQMFVRTIWILRSLFDCFCREAFYFCATGGQTALRCAENVCERGQKTLKTMQPCYRKRCWSFNFTSLLTCVCGGDLLFLVQSSGVTRSQQLTGSQVAHIGPDGGECLPAQWRQTERTNSKSSVFKL